MKCFNHPQTDSVAQCSQCQRGLCTICTHNVERATLCSSCFESGLREEIAHAQRRITRAWIFIGALTIITTIGASSQNGAGAILLIPVAFAASWCLYWGWFPVWNWFRKVFEGWGCFAPWYFILAFVLVLFGGIILPIATVVGAFTGIQKYQEARRTVLNGNRMLAELYATPPTQRLPGSQGGSTI